MELFFLGMLILLTLSGTAYALFGPTTEPMNFYRKFGWGFLAPLLFLWCLIETSIKMFIHYRQYRKS